MMPAARRLATVTLLAVVVLGATVVSCTAPSDETDLHLDEPWFGVLEPELDRAAELRAAGIQVVMLAVSWNSYEPEQGRGDPAYQRTVRERYADLRRAGHEVVLSPGLQCPPSWVFELDDHTRFVDQYGEPWHGDVGQDVPNAVFNPKVRRAQEDYLHRIADDLADLEFFGVRASGLPDDELRYPEARAGGPPDSFWAFDHHAQAASPVPGWKPGQPGVDEANAFLEFYLDSLAGYGEWSVATHRAAFGASPTLMVQLGSWGVRPGDIDAAAATRLDGSSPGVSRETLQQGLDWERQLPRFAQADGVIVSGTWMDAPDQGTEVGDESPIRYIARLAEPLGLGVIGENTGRNDADEMLRSVRRVVDLDLEGMMWMRGPDLFTDEGYASIDDYAAAIAGVREASVNGEERFDRTSGQSAAESS